MKILMNPFKILAFLMAMLTFCMPFITFAQQDYSIQIEAQRDAEAEAEARTNKNLWFMVGCVGGVFGVAGAYLYEPSPASSAFLGKSPEYVAFYTDAYAEKVRTLQTNRALTGCIVNGLTIAIYYAVVIALAVESAADELTFE